MLFSHFTQNCIFLYFFEAKNPYFVTKNCWKSSYICVFILSRKRRNWFHKNPHNSGTVGCPTPRWIAFLMLYRLVYNIRSHFNELILAWSTYSNTYHEHSFFVFLFVIVFHFVDLFFENIVFERYVSCFNPNMGVFCFEDRFELWVGKFTTDHLPPHPVHTAIQLCSYARNFKFGMLVHTQI